MIIENIAPRGPRNWVVIDLESAVICEAGHRRYQAMERYVPSADERSRRGYTRSEDPSVTPRWVFQTITTASVMVLGEHSDGGVDVIAWETFSAPDQDEKGVITGVLQALEDAPSGAELCSWAGSAHDVPMLVLAACRYGMTLPRAWRWAAFNPGDPKRHFDLARACTGGLRMKPVHMAEVAATLGVPAKMTAPAFAVAKLIEAGRWAEVRDCCEGDVVTTALLLARWRKLADEEADPGIVEDRLLRRMQELRPDRTYIAELTARRDKRFADQVARAANDAAVLAPWLDVDAA